MRRLQTVLWTIAFVLFFVLPLIGGSRYVGFPAQ